MADGATTPVEFCITIACTGAADPGIFKWSIKRGGPVMLDVIRLQSLAATCRNSLVLTAPVIAAILELYSAVNRGLSMLLPALSIAALVMLPIFLDYQQPEVSKTQPQEQEKRIENEQKPQVPPDSVMKNLRTNFEKLDSNMCDDEVFRTLGLTEYRNYLKANSRYMMDGAGGDWRYFIDKRNGYSLAFRSFWGARVECLLKLPDENHWRTKRVKVKPIKPTYLELNPKSNR